jgi:hypothetical protein
MVTITNYFVRQTQEGKSFIALELTGDLELIQSSGTGRFYATAKRCSVSSVFTEEVAKTLVGKTLPGRIDRVETAPYDYVVPGTGEIRSLSHTYVYRPEEKAGQAIENPKVLVPL